MKIAYQIHISYCKLLMLILPKILCYEVYPLLPKLSYEDSTKYLKHLGLLVFNPKCLCSIVARYEDSMLILHLRQSYWCLQYCPSYTVISKSHNLSYEDSSKSSKAFRAICSRDYICAVKNYLMKIAHWTFKLLHLNYRK